MKKSISLVLFLMILLIGMSGCNQQAAENSVKDPDKLLVYTSFYPMYDLTQKIGGDRIVLKNMVPTGTEPHDWEPSAADIVNLEKAQVFIYNGAGVEHWATQVLASLENKELLTVEATQGLNIVEDDGHAWISIRLAKAEMANIKAALVEADPDNAQYYEDNYQHYATLFDELDQAFTGTISVLPKKDIVVAHQAFGYLCADYGLNQIAIEGLSAESEPDPARMKEIINLARERQVTTIFFEELVSPEVAETIAAELGIKTAVLNPLEGLTKEQEAAGADYLSIMEENLAALKAALQ
jgi:zinc transport system substrate-binding protein